MKQPVCPGLVKAEVVEVVSHCVCMLCKVLSPHPNHEVLWKYKSWR